jgi:aryl-alcohol dehydrogenase-like predicted oxidoreductase
VEDTLDAIAALLHARSVRSFGVSNYASWQILEIIQLCDRRSMPRPAVAQQIYNLLIRQLDLEYFRFAKRYGVHTTVYNPLAGGLLTGRYKSGDEVAKGSRFDGNRLYQGRYWTPRMIAHAEAFHGLARDEGIGLVELAYAWLASVSGVDSILVGPGSVAHLDAALDAIQRPLSEQARKRIDELHRAYAGTETSYAR